jgi:PAS domain S-box-containing protein
MTIHDSRRPGSGDDLQSLQASERRLRALIEHGWDVVAEISPKGKLRYMSPASLRVFGYTQEELAARGQFDLIHPDDVARVAAAFENFLVAAGESRTFEYRYRHKSGEWRWVEGVATNLVEDANVEAIIVNYRDITERKLVEARLQESEERFRKLIENSWDALVLLDLSGTIIYASHSTQRVVGYAKEEFVGCSVFQFIHPDDLDRTASELLALLQMPGASTTTVFRYRHKTGDWRWLEGAGTNLLEEPGVNAVVANFRDVTEVRQAERERAELLAREHASRIEAERANQAKDDFLSVLGHELRNPIAAIQGAIKAMELAGAPEPSEAREILARQAVQLNRLVEDLLDISRLGSGKLTLERVPVDLRRTVDLCVGSLANSPRMARRRIDATGDSVWVDGDPTRLEQVVANLLDNAVKFSSSASHIAVDVRCVGDFAVLSVKDDGRGIAPDMLPRIFDFFVQGEPTLDRAKTGLGIGLTLVRRLVERHGGTIEARSAGLGRGSEFIVRLAAREPPAEAAQTIADVPAPGRARRIVVVEDNDDVRDVLREVLELMGHEVATAGDGEIGYATILDKHPDVAFIDLGLPLMNGYEVAARVRQNDRHTRLVALTGYGQPEHRRRALAAGFDLLIVKPLDPDKFGEILDRLDSMPRRDSMQQRPQRPLPTL